MHDARVQGGYGRRVALTEEQAVVVPDKSKHENESFALRGANDVWDVESISSDWSRSCEEDSESESDRDNESESEDSSGIRDVKYELTSSSSDSSDDDQPVVQRQIRSRRTNGDENGFVRRAVSCTDVAEGCDEEKRVATHRVGSDSGNKRVVRTSVSCENPFRGVVHASREQGIVRQAQISVTPVLQDSNEGNNGDNRNAGMSLSYSDFDEEEEALAAMVLRDVWGVHSDGSAASRDGSEDEDGDETQSLVCSDEN